MSLFYFWESIIRDGCLWKVEGVKVGRRGGEGVNINTVNTCVELS